MLIRFAVENYLSFKEMTEFSMVASKITRHSDHVAVVNSKRILKGAFLFGANASGKTNFIRAFGFARDIITQGLDNTNCDKRYFRIDAANQNKLGSFQFDLLSGGHFYSYGFALSYSEPSIEEEWLYRIDDNKDFCVFLRTKSKDGESYDFASDLRFDNKTQQERFKVYADDISTPKMRKTLFLSDVALRSPDDELDYQAFRDVMGWFRRLIIIFPESKYGAITELLDNIDERTRLERLLNYFDTGIYSVSKKELEFDKAFPNFPEKMLNKMIVNITKTLNEDGQSALVQHDSAMIEVKQKKGDLLAYEVVSNHGNKDDLFKYRDESDGTQRLFDLIPVYQKALENSVILIDELDRSLHTKAVQEFINYFYSISKNVNAQLIVTTHDSNIMDLDFIRQDEIWFVERNQNDQSSQIYSLNKFKARFDKKVEKEYLIGRYGAIPIFNRFYLNTDSAEDGAEDERIEK